MMKKKKKQLLQNCLLEITIAKMNYVNDGHLECLITTISPLQCSVRYRFYYKTIHCAIQSKDANLNYARL